MTLYCPSRILQQSIVIAFLAKALKISVEELITLKAMSGLNPFVELIYLDPDDNTKYKKPAALTFIELAQLIKQSDFKIKTLSYLLQHEDVTGKASPSIDSILSLAKTLKDGLFRIEQDLKLKMIKLVKSSNQRWLWCMKMP